MTEQELSRHQKWLRLKYGDDGEDIFHQAWIYAIQAYSEIEKVNQSLFGLLCKWAARELKKHERYEIPFSCLIQENADQTDFVEFDPADEEWRKDFDAIENREEVQKKYGQRILNALIKSATRNARKEEEKEEEQLKFEFVA
jgi:hypothetical protein